MGQDRKVIAVRNSDPNWDWWTIEWADHANESRLAPTSYGCSLFYSGRVCDADVEGTTAEMLSIAEAIEAEGSVEHRRCSVEWLDHGVELMSPRNSETPGVITHDQARELAADIRSKIGND